MNHNFKVYVSTGFTFSVTFYPFQVAKEFGFNTNGFSVYQNRNKTGEIISQNKSLSLLKIK